MNGEGIMGWDADVVTWATITVDVTIDFEVRINNAPFIDEAIDDAYETEWVASGSKTKTYTFTREAFGLDYAPTVTANKWQVARGLAGTGSAGTPPFFRDVFSNVFFGGSPNFTDEAEAWAVDWELNYTKVGPDTGGSIPADSSGTENCFARLELDLSFAGEVPTWVVFIGAYDGGGIPVGDILLPAGSQGQGGASRRVTLPAMLDGFDGPNVFVHNRKTTSGDLIDFGGTVSVSTSAAADGWDSNYTVTTYTKAVEAVITCT